MMRLAPQPERRPSITAAARRHDLDGGELRGISRAKACVTRPMIKQSASFNAIPRARREASSPERAREERSGAWRESPLRVCW
jgi:hypothetical protein